MLSLKTAQSAKIFIQGGILMIGISVYQFIVLKKGITLDSAVQVRLLLSDNILIPIIAGLLCIAWGIFVLKKVAKS